MMRIAQLLAVALVGLAFAGAPAARAQPVPDSGRIVLLPGKIEVHADGHLRDTVDAPVPLDLADLPRLVNDATMVSQAGQVIEVRVPIEQRPGSRLAITRATRELRLTARGRLRGSGAILSISETTLSGSGRTPGKPSDENALIGYDGSGVRMSRVRILDGRTGRGAGRAVDLAGGQVRLVSTLITGGAGAIRLDGVGAAEVSGVQIEGSRGTGLTAGGATSLTLRDVTLSGNAMGGLVLTGRALKLTTDGWVVLQRNAGQSVRLVHTRALDLTGIRVGSSPGTPHPRSERGAAALNLVFPLAIGLALLLAAVILEVIRARRDEREVLVAPDYVLNR